MPYVHERFNEHEFERLKQGKGDRTWRETLLEDVADMEADTA